MRQPCCLWSFAERESTLLFFPSPCFFFYSFFTSLPSTVFLQNVKTSEVGVLNLSSAPRALITTPRWWVSRITCTHGARRGLYELGICLFHERIMGGFVRECPSACARRVSNMDPGRAGPFAMSVEITRSPSPCRVFIALLSGSTVFIVGSFLGRAENWAAGFRQRTLTLRFCHPSCHFLLKLRMRIWLPIHPRKAIPPLPHDWEKKKTTGGGVRPRHLISLPRRLRTSAPRILLCRILFEYRRTFFVLAQQRAGKCALLDRHVVVGGEIGESGPTISELAIN